MADHSFEAENSSANARGRRRHTTPARSQYPSTSFSTSSSYIFPQFSGPGRRAYPTPASPFATDDDKSWKGELSWQFEPSGWQENRDFGSAFSPWATTSVASTRSRIFRRSANDYYLSHTNGAFQSYGNSYQDFSRSGYDLVPTGRLELQSYVARGNHGGAFSERSYASHEHTRTRASPMLLSIKEGSAGNSGPLVDTDEMSIDHGVPRDMDRQIRLIDTYRDCNQEQDPRWFSVSHAYMDGGNVHASHDHKGHHDLGFADHSHHHHGDHSAMQGGLDHVPAFEEEDDDEEDEAVAPRSVGLFGLFRYSTMLDFVLIFFGCLGALINGGSLPFYSLLFGKFVNKLALGGEDKKKMMQEVDSVWFFFPYSLSFDLGYFIRIVI